MMLLGKGIIIEKGQEKVFPHSMVHYTLSLRLYHLEIYVIHTTVGYKASNPHLPIQDIYLLY